ncbi:MAG: hypothetical protein NXI04_00965 [Planctomycetaceae bacterium]|nr:hypothetical protein [Planctomycetaceae bacterium]
MKRLFNFCAVALLCCAPAVGADWGLKRGTPDLKSAGSLAFGPQDILFVGDTKSATVFAIATGDLEGDPAKSSINLSDVGRMVSDVVGGPATINDLVVNPTTGVAFASVTAGEQAALISINGAGKISRLDLTDVPFASVTLDNVPPDGASGQGRRRRNYRSEAITDLAFFEGKVLISGLRSEGSPSSVREIAFPFAKSDQGVGVQIFHGAHGREEDYSAMRTFVPLMIDGEPNLLAAYVCTPLVRIPLEQIREAGESVKGVTVAELGNRNRPLDMISYTKGGQDFLLLSNSARGVMKITTAGLSDNPGLSERVSGTAGQTYDTIESLKGTIQMDRLNDTHALVLLAKDGQMDLVTVELP